MNPLSPLTPEMVIAQALPAAHAAGFVSRVGGNVEERRTGVPGRYRTRLAAEVAALRYARQLRRDAGADEGAPYEIVTIGGARVTVPASFVGTVLDGFNETEHAFMTRSERRALEREQRRSEP